MRKELTALRTKMKERGIDLYIVPTTDAHGSEYVNDHFKCREYISGFTGSAGTLVVQSDFAGLWTDGRYFLQAEQQLRGSGITLMKMGEPDVPELESYLKEQPAGSTIGFDGTIISHRLGAALEQNFHIVYDLDLVDEIWADRPRIRPSKIYALPQNVTGEATNLKMVRVRAEMGAADYLLVSRLEDIAWLYNLRGRDIENTPVFYAFALISKDRDVLYVMDETYHAEDGQIKPYQDVFGNLKKLKNCTVMLDEDSVSYTISRCLDESVDCLFRKSPVERLKAVKNAVEIRSTKHAHLRDGAAMVNFLYWLKSNIGRILISEISAADYLEMCRREQGAYDLSFPTIAGYEAHGAIVHYAATADSNTDLQQKGLLLIDSGGQYEDGTTDITRTVALGDLDALRRTHYTAVLKGHIALADAVFAKGTVGADLDFLARRPLQDLELDFKHGTGHGVGHMLSVHEGPNTISPRAKNCEILPGMITSDEPGVYLEDRYGIRIENELLCVERAGQYAFETITLCPYEREAIEVSMLTESEIAYIDRYHAKVYETLTPLLETPIRDWLQQQCRPLLQG